MRVGMSLWMIAMAVFVPFLVGLCAAWPFWTRRVADEIGSIVGSGVILAFTVGFIARELGDVLEVTRRCVDAEIPCRLRPEPFMRYAIYAGIGLVQVFGVFVVGLNVAERMNSQGGNRDGE